MTANEIIREIDSLPPAELAKVVSPTKELDKRRPLSGSELTELAQRMVSASDPAEPIGFKRNWSRGSSVRVR